MGNRLGGSLASVTRLSSSQGAILMWHSCARVVLLIGLVLFVSAPSPACICTPYDSGYVSTSHSTQENVIVYSTVRHNHWESGGTFSISSTVSTGNSWSIGASAGYEGTTSAEVKAGVLASVTAAAKVQVGVNGQLTGSGNHQWTITDTVDKQACKCPVYKDWVDKPTENGRRQKGYYWDYCETPEDDHVLVLSESAEGNGTGDWNEEAGVVSNYVYKQTASSCTDCYGSGNTCPGE